MNSTIRNMILLIFCISCFLGCEKSEPVVSSECVIHEELVMHIHVTIVVVANGSPMMLPPNIGVEPDCMKALHTHDGSSLVHIESPKQKEFTLLDFMDVWGDQNPYRELPDINISLNGELFPGKFQDLILNDGDRIVVDYREAR